MFLCAAFLLGSCAEQTGASVRRTLGPWAWVCAAYMVPAQRHASLGLWLRQPPGGGGMLGGQAARLSGAPIHLVSCCVVLLPSADASPGATRRQCWDSGPSQPASSLVAGELFASTQAKVAL